MSEAQEGSTRQVVGRWMGIVGLFVAPTTVITSLCFYFGYVYMRKYLGYFGIDSDALGFTGAEYVLRSVQVLYTPLLVLLVCWAAALWAGGYLRHLASDSGRHGALRRAAWATIAVGTLGVLTAIAVMLIPEFHSVRSTLLTPLALGLGTTGLIVGTWLLGMCRDDVLSEGPRPFALAERVSAVIAGAAILMSLFWITDMWANKAGQDRAESAKGDLWGKETGVVVDTIQRLNVPCDLILETPQNPQCTADDKPNSPPLQELTYRYECFRTIAVRGNQWVLVPAKWTPEKGYAVIVTNDSVNRISVVKHQDIVDKIAAKWTDPWQCLEVAP